MKKQILVMVGVLCLCGAAFAKKFPVTASPSVPAARGDLNISTDKNGNDRLKLDVQHLADPSSLTPPGGTYVVWIQSRGGNPENQGRLKVDKNLKAVFETVTPYKDFQLMVTAEQDPTAKAPTGIQVLNVNVQP
jgi:hypothetical protein